MISKRRLALPALCALLAAVAACGDGSTEPVFGPRFTLPDDPATAIPLSDLPYPNDALRGPTGTLQVTEETLPLSERADELARANIAAALAERDCFGVTSGVIFPIDGSDLEDPLAPDTLAASVKLVDLDSGEQLPIETHYRELEGELSLRPQYGTLLRQGRHYAAYVTTEAATMSGRRLAAQPQLSAVLAGDEHQRATSAYAPLRDYLATAGVDPTTLAGATVFTTCDFAADFRAVQAQLDAAGAPAAAIERVLAGGAELDDLLGTPPESFPGSDNPGGIAHDHIAFVALGTFPSPNYQSATPNLLGRWEHDATGDPIAKGTDDVPFLLVLPVADSYANTPVIVFQHGLNNSRTQVLEVADTLAAHGFATIGIDIPFHGERFPNAADNKHNFTDVREPDGIADPSGATAATFFFDILGDDQVDWLDPRVMQASFRQASVDMMSLARLLADGDWSELAQTAGLADLTFLGDRIVFASESFGGIIGLTAVAYEPRYGAAFMSVAGGGLLDRLLESSPIYGGLFLPILGGALDVAPNEIDPSYDPPHTHIAFQLLGPLLDAGDPIAHASEVADAGIHLALANAYADESVPNQASEALAGVAGVEWVQLTGSREQPRFATALPHAGAPPLEGNVDGVTAVAFELDPATHGMITRRWGEQHYEPDFPPTTALPETLEVENPIRELQEQLAEYAASYVATGTPRLIDPFAPQP